jgi:hypothetical protein
MNRRLGQLVKRIRNFYRSRRAVSFARRPRRWPAERPFVSFTFDDFPRSAYFTGGKILEKYGARGSFYAAFGLMGKSSPSGDIFVAEDLGPMIAAGHEIGCHSFGHLAAWGTSPRFFERSLLENREAMEKVVPGYRLRTHGYPLCEPHPGVKRAAGRLFLCCRGGGQMINDGEVDLNLLRSCFIDAKNRHDIRLFQELVEDNRRRRGWLIFATHDVGLDPSLYGCDTALFEEIVRRVAESGAVVRPVCEVVSEFEGRDAR